jgi:hypothetical protein
MDYKAYSVLKENMNESPLNKRKIIFNLHSEYFTNDYNFDIFKNIDKLFNYGCKNHTPKEWRSAYLSLFI